MGGIADESPEWAREDQLGPWGTRAVTLVPFPTAGPDCGEATASNKLAAASRSDANGCFGMRFAIAFAEMESTSDHSSPLAHYGRNRHTFRIPPSSIGSRLSSAARTSPAPIDGLCLSRRHEPRPRFLSYQPMPMTLRTGVDRMVVLPFVCATRRPAPHDESGLACADGGP
jgi:hypothetical protein